MLRQLPEYLLAIIGAAFCLADALLFAQYQNSSSYPSPFSIWPLPGLYLLEIVALGTLGFIGVALDDPPRSARWGAVIWMVAGGLLTFVILGAWTIGPLLIPAAIAFCIAGALADWRRSPTGRLWRQNMWPHLGLWIVAAVAQAVLMLMVIALA